jgi:hypothetical protein
VTPTDLVSLIDRFIDGNVSYPLEWDDFISWPQDNPNLEAVRLRIGERESLLFSDKAEDKTKYGQIVINERNRLAAILGIPQR